jgi:hypothetical protein
MTGVAIEITGFQVIVWSNGSGVSLTLHGAEG